MKIKTDSEENKVVLVPENDIDLFHLGKVFGRKVAHITNMSEGKINYISVDTKVFNRRFPIPVHYKEVSRFALIVRKVRHFKNGSCGFIGENCVYCGRRLPLGVSRKDKLWIGLKDRVQKVL